MKMTTRYGFLLVMSVMAIASVGLSQEGPPPGPPGDQDGQGAEQQTVSGAVMNFNYGPRGDVNGLILSSDGKITQINFPPQMAKTIKASVAVGDHVAALVEEEHGPQGRGGPGGQDGGPGGGPGGGGGDAQADQPKASHPVYRLERLTDAHGKQIGAGHSPRKEVHVQSTIKAVNYDMRGTPNGAQLASGEFVQIAPQEAEGMNLKASQSLTVDGMESTSPEGTVVIMATAINGTEVQGDNGGPGGGGGGGPGGGGPGGGGGDNGGPPGPPPGQ
jgi:hypothetical protein